MKLVITVPWGERLGGAERMLYDFLRHARSDLTPTVVFLGEGPFVADVAGLGVETIALSAGRLREVGNYVSTVRAIAATIRRTRPRLVLDWSAKAHLYGGAAAGSMGLRRRTVWWQHELPRTGWIDRAAPILAARAIGCSSRAVACAQRRRWPERATFVVHPGIDPAPAHEENADVPALEGASFVVGIVGRLQRWKGQHRLVAAIERLRRRGRDVRGLIVGGDAHGIDPGYGRALRRMVSQLGLEDAIALTGHVSDPGPYIRRMDVLVNTSDGEPFGISLLEAMARRVPVVAMDEAGPREIVEPGRSGILLDPGDDDALVETLARLGSDAPLRQRLGEAGQRRFEEHFRASRMAEELSSRLIRLAAA